MLALQTGLLTGCAWISDDEHAALVCVLAGTCTEADSGATPTPTASDSGTPTNRPPDVVEVALEPVEVYTDTPVEAIVRAEDPDGDDVALAFTWFVDGEIADETGAIRPAEAFTKGTELQVEVTPSDGLLDGESRVSELETVLNTLPTAPGVSIDPALPDEDTEALLCLLETPGTDADEDDLVTHAFAWEVDGAAWSETTTTTWPDDTAVVPDDRPEATWTCAVTPSDGEGDGVPGTASVEVPGCSDQEGLVAWWAMDGSWADAGCGGHDGPS